MDKLRSMIIDKMERADYNIKSCPFCGSSSLVTTSEDTFTKLQDENGAACLIISCNNCNLDMYEHTRDEKNYYIRLFYLIEKWNERAEVK